MPLDVSVMQSHGCDPRGRREAVIEAACFQLFFIFFMGTWGFRILKVAPLKLQSQMLVRGHQKTDCDRVAGQLSGGLAWPPPVSSNIPTLFHWWIPVLNVCSADLISHRLKPFIFQRRLTSLTALSPLWSLTLHQLLCHIIPASHSRLHADKWGGIFATMANISHLHFRAGLWWNGFSHLHFRAGLHWNI